jgi:hypothetical protein
MVRPVLQQAVLKRLVTIFENEEIAQKILPTFCTYAQVYVRSRWDTEFFRDKKTWNSNRSKFTKPTLKTARDFQRQLKAFKPEVARVLDGHIHGHLQNFLHELTRMIKGLERMEELFIPIPRTARTTHREDFLGLLVDGFKEAGIEVNASIGTPCYQAAAYWLELVGENIEKEQIDRTIKEVFTNKHQR